MFRPVNDYVLLEKLEVFNPQAAGIVIPEGIKERPVVRARVVAVGPGKLGKRGRIEPRVKAGDECWFNQYDQTTHELEVDGEKRLLVREADLLVAVE